MNPLRQQSKIKIPKSKIRLALFGGTFNPVHNGHLIIAEAAREAYRLDRVIFVPSGRPPHKKALLTSPAHRLAMLRLSLRGNPAFGLSDWEVRAGRVVYTYETAEHFQARYPKASLYLLLGADAMRSLRNWRHPERIKAVCRLIPAGRLPSYASSEIRSRVRRHRSIRYRVPEAVERYIRKHHLYRRPE